MTGFRDFKDLLSLASDLTEDRDRPIELAAFVEPDAPGSLLDVLKEALRPETTTASVDVGVVEERSPGLGETLPDAVVIAVGGAGSGAASLVSEARDRAVPVVALVLGPDVGEVDRRLGQPTSDVVPGMDRETLLDGLARWLADRLTHKRLALASNFRFTRRSVAEETVQATAWQNAVVGTVTIIPGADMPIMTANQARMLLRIAAAFGQRIGADRIKELGAVVGAGFTFRTIARQGLSLLPGFGWAIKGGVAYSGTLAMGKAAIRYFEEDVDVVEVGRRLVEQGADLLEEARGRAGARRASAPAVAPGEQEALPLDAGDASDGQSRVSD